MPQPPKLTDSQRAAALVRAAEVRRIRAETKMRLKMGTVTFSELIDMAENDQVIAKIKVLAVLESLPGVGKVKARRTMEDIGIADSRRLAGLGPHQLAALMEQFS